MSFVSTDIKQYEIIRNGIVITSGDKHIVTYMVDG